MNIRTSLKDRLRMSMPVVVDAGKGSPFHTIDRKFKDSNFIIHQACFVEGKLSDHIEGLNFCIIFLNKFAKNVDHYSEYWITGDIVQTLINHTNKKVKYVFDQTTIHQEGWIDKKTLSQQLSI